MSELDLSGAIEMLACSDTGRVRQNNEDAVLANAALGFAILADGMGGHNAGEVASSMVIAMIGKALEQTPAELEIPATARNRLARHHAVMRDAIRHANTAVHSAAQDNAKFSGMGTTLVAARFFDDRVVVAHIGDSRLYRMRDGCLTRLTRDHSLLQELMDKGLITPEEARFAPNRNRVTRALGVASDVETELNDFETVPGDIYLLCSDGLSDMAEDPEIAATLNSFSGNLQLCAAQLVTMANEYGGRDNVSVILVRIKATLPAFPVTRG